MGFWDKLWLARGMAHSNLPASNMKRTKTVRRCPRVAVCVDKTGGYGRGLLRGIAEYVEACGPWSLCLDHHASGHYASDWLRHWNGDGVLAYVDTPALAGQLCRSRIPAVEVFGTRLDLNLPQVVNDEPAFGRLAAEHLLGNLRCRGSGNDLAIQGCPTVPNIDCHEDRRIGKRTTVGADCSHT